MNNIDLRPKQRGFTIVELSVALGISAMIAVTVVWLIIDGLRYSNVIFDQLQTQNDGRRVLQQVVDVVRKAEESSIGGYPLVSAGEYELIVYANVDSDSLRERVRFWLDGTTLKKGVIKPSGSPLSYSGAEQTVEIAHDVVNFSENEPLFLYYDENYTGTEAALIQPVEEVDVRMVRVRLELEEDPDKSPVPLEVESAAMMRNLKEN
ncbi:MAG: type II secretion system protein [Candidatus Magasanikbacteria bacterium]|nr:type II secretion system protein [Candidatus Magasanikbacteria bacterium]